MEKAINRRRSATEPKKKSMRGRVITSLIALVILTTLVFSIIESSDAIRGFTGSAAMLSAKLSVPQGAGEVMSENMDYLAGIMGSGGTQSRAVPAITSKPPASSSSAVSSSSKSGIPAGCKPVRNIQLGAQTGDLYENFLNLCVYRYAKQVKSADIKNQLSIAPDIQINLKTTPQVLIIHTHTTETYTSSDQGYYDPNAATRDTDKSKSVVRVGDEITKYLEKNGIGVLHDTNYYDYPNFDGAYGRSLAAIQDDLQKNPSIKVVLDIHRDLIQENDGTRVKPTIMVNGKKAAQILLISGCGEPESSLTVPDWKQNYRFALRIQQQLNKSYAGLTRPLELVDKQYNQQASHGSLLVEIGTDVNTLDEAVYSGQLFGQALSTVLKNLQG